MCCSNGTSPVTVLCSALARAIRYDSTPRPCASPWTPPPGGSSIQETAHGLRCSIFSSGAVAPWTCASTLLEISVGARVHAVPERHAVRQPARAVDGLGPFFGRDVQVGLERQPGAGRQARRRRRPAADNPTPATHGRNPRDKACGRRKSLFQTQLFAVAAGPAAKKRLAAASPCHQPRPRQTRGGSGHGRGVGHPPAYTEKARVPESRKWIEGLKNRAQNG